MTNQQIARILYETASMLELTGENPFRSRAYRHAGRAVEQMEERAADRLAEGTLTDVPGIGAGLEAQIRALVETGSFTLYDELRAQTPPGLAQLLRIKGLGVKKARLLWQELGITSVAELEAAAASGRLAETPGFGGKTQARIVAGIELFRRYDTRRRYAGTLLNTLPILHRLRQAEGVAKAEVAGELRRCLETVARVDLIAAADAVGRVEGAFADWRTAAPPTAGPAGGTVLEGMLADGFPVSLLVVPPAVFGTAWWRATGSERHVAAYEARYGPPPDVPDEADVYARAGLAVVPPELREGDGELEAAAAGALPGLIAVDDLRGTLHNHSTYSDGADTLADMARAARDMGLSYFGICDHSQSLTIARGLSVADVRRQQAEIRALNDAFAADGGPPFRLFSGIECDILADGSLDYPDDVLASFDFVVASIHSGFEMTEAAATERLLRAVENPYTTILGHATGRLLLAREGYPIDHRTVIAACAASGVAVELNANPYRLDMDWRWLRHATAQGVRIAINPDAHSVDELHNVRWGVAVARKGWLTAADCLNALSLDAFTGWLNQRRLRKGNRGSRRAAP